MSILIEERHCAEGRLGILTLDEPDRINALSEAMIDAMQAALDRWADDDRICLVLLQGAGDKGFCAGGNLRKLYDALSGGADSGAPVRFFSKEYRLDYSLHRFPKPVVAWAQGVVMGGGLGLLSACRYRLVTPDLTMAMPEIHIGLFPDVGASWFLNRLPEGLGLFLGLTGARLNASDALRVGLADLPVYPQQREALIDAMVATRWTGEVAADDNRLYRLLNRMETPPHHDLPDSHLARHEQTIARICREGDLGTISTRLRAEQSDDPWWRDCMENLQNGCPMTAWLVHEQLERGRQMSLKDVFRMELVMAANCARQPDLAEGIRARMIDKDHQPRWRHRRIEDVTADQVEAHFQPPWAGQDDPLASL